MTGHKTDDCIIRVGEQEFTAKKSLLMECSTFLKEELMYKSDTDIDITQTLSDPDIYKVVHDGITLEKMSLNELNMIDVWKACRVLGIKKWEDHCEKYVARHLVKSNYLLLLKNALAMESTIVTEKMINLIDEHFDSFCKTQLFLGLNSEMVINIINKSKCISTDDLVQAVDQWLDKNDPDPNQAMEQNNPEQVQGTSSNPTVDIKQVGLGHHEEAKAFEVRSIILKKFSLDQLTGHIKEIFQKIEKRYMKEKPFEIPAWLAKRYKEIGWHYVDFKYHQSANKTVAVYVKNNTFWMYSLATEIRYELKIQINEQIQDFYVFANDLYYTTEVNGRLETFKVTEPTKATSLEGVGVSLNERRYFMVYPFIYEFKVQDKDLIVSSFDINAQERNWEGKHAITLDNTVDIFDCILFLNNYIIFNRKSKIAYFNVKKQKIFSTASKNQSSTVLLGKDCDFLYSDGQACKVIEQGDTLNFKDNWFIVWKYYTTDVLMYGAKLYNEICFVFTDDNRQKTSWDPPMVETKYVELHGDVIGKKTKCVFMNVPDDWLW
ncbi:uncharacterized protein LOC131956233 [Physella acuta]|uniref:uncharacterized protein LOC131956233 n=1 Tax=Physella acuta TaxID=109671 RepID=UPI0027DE6C93|nr:uncharacterized protein LOC131956233 [Physella acuta]XP_059176634.1 uncharacterized protein LOC131956233 [Physella acuta]XP_059176636.1 uncharacterized protein LOC131956233 [Physella acuta]XP_059176637.1 uncharacterized protein LOC131956233 [Physella acuta]